MERDLKKEIKEEFDARNKDLNEVQEKLGQNRNTQQALRNQEVQLIKTIDNLNGAIYILNKLMNPLPAPAAEKGKEDGQGKEEVSKEGA